MKRSFLFWGREGWDGTSGVITFRDDAWGEKDESGGDGHPKGGRSEKEKKGKRS